MTTRAKRFPGRKSAPKLPTAPRNREHTTTTPQRPQPPLTPRKEAQFEAPHTSPLAAGDEIALDEVIEIDDSYVSPLADWNDTDLHIQETLKSPRTSLEVATQRSQKRSAKKGGNKSEVKDDRPKLSRKVMITDQDRRIFEALDWMGRATNAHIAFAIGNTPINIKSRLTFLTKKGYLLARKGESMVQYGVTRKGLTEINSPEAPMADPSPSTMSHRSKLNSTIVLFKIGGNEFMHLISKDSRDYAMAMETRNRGQRDYNIMLEAQKAEIAEVPEVERTEEQRSIMKRRARKLVEIPEIPDVEITQHETQSDPQVVHVERIILRDSAIHGDLACQREWLYECNELMSYPNFPVRTPDDDRTVSEAERQIMDEAVSGKTWQFRHWNPDRTFEKKHTPDGILVLPHRVQDDGTLKPGSFWIELEDQRKTLPEVVRACKQAIDAPNVRGTIYFTDAKEIANLVKRARTEIAKEYAVQDTSPRPFEARLADAQAKVDDAIRLKKVTFLNKHRNNTGRWG